MAGDSLARRPGNVLRCVHARRPLRGARRGGRLGWALALAGALGLGFLAAAPTSFAQPLGGTECSDAIDNDADGFIDLADPSCLGDAQNDTETLGTQCDDNLDNEPDGQTDLADAGCLADLLRDDETGELVVNSTLDKVDAIPGNGRCETQILGECTVRAAIMEANAAAGEQGVQVPAGTFELTIRRRLGNPGTAHGDLDIADDLVLIGAGAEHTRIAGSGGFGPFYDRAFEILPAAQVTLAGVTVEHAGLNVRGGGIYINDGGTLTLTDVSVSDNQTADTGGGIHNAGTLTITNSTVSGNYGTTGGGIYIGYGGTLTLTDSTVSDNTTGKYYAYGGAGIYSRGTATLINSTVSGNYALSNLGGGGIRNSGIMSLTNTTVSGNFAGSTNIPASGGGIINLGTLILMNSSVSENEAYPASGGYGIEAVGPTQLLNSIIAANGSDNCSGSIISNGHNLADDTTCFAGSGTDLVVADAMLGPLADNGGSTETHDLLPGSPAIDAGSPGCPPPATDQRGVARPVDGNGDGIARCDIGAVEYVPEPGRRLLLAAGVGVLVLLRSVSRR
jgi:hypothetical protein